MDGILGLADLTIDSKIPAIPPFPSEIVDLVIDQLEQDKTTLEVCSLVCRSWLPRARHHLFSTFDIHTKSASAIDLLTSPLCTIPPHVRRVKFSIDEKLETARIAACIQELADGGSNLLSLSVKTVPGGGMTWVDDHLQALFSAPILKNLRHLKLMYLRFNNLNDSIRLYSSLPALESLVLYGVDSCIRDDQNAYTMPPPPNLRHLFIWTIDIPDELCWLTVHPGHPLTTFHLYNITSASGPIILNYLRLSSQLQCLSFDFCGGGTPENFSVNFMTQIDLTSQKNLRCLRLRSNQVVPLFSNLVPRICPPHIEEITLSTYGGSRGSLAWADLGEVFTSPSVRGLKRLYVGKMHVRDVMEALPEFASCGIILPLRRGEFRHAMTNLTALY
ncbi:hypothetical protein BD779DRAFT_1677352 [Infundibulicybe gibba]|nr:hypothetical protein BD779DRAFT_1677352 [Infundibulicybe gibba]